MKEEKKKDDCDFVLDHNQPSRTRILLRRRRKWTRQIQTLVEILSSSSVGGGVHKLWTENFINGMEIVFSGWVGVCDDGVE